MGGPQIRLCLLTFRPIASKQLNSMTSTVDLGGAGNVSALGAIGAVFNSRLRQGFSYLIFVGTNQPP